MLHVDDLIEASPEQIAFTYRLRLVWSHRLLRYNHRITIGDSLESQTEFASFRPLKPPNLANSKPRPAAKSTPAQWLGWFLPANSIIGPNQKLRNGGDRLQERRDRGCGSMRA